MIPTNKINTNWVGVIVNSYIPKYFKAYEVVPKEIVDTVEEYKIWMLFDSRILWTIDRIRELYGASMVVNNWNSGGPFTLRGWRPFSCNLTPGIIVDQHKLGRAIDFNINGVDPSEFVHDVLNNQKQYEFQFITGLELSPTWNHIDCRNFDKTKNNNLPLTFKA